MKRILFPALLLALVIATPAHADFTAGKSAYDTKNWEQAIRHLRPLAESGEARAMVLLGNMYAQGYGVTRNEAEAYTLYHRAALAGNNEAMVVTAAMLQQGIGTEANIPQAIAWYKRAADSGHPGGAFFYALYLLRGNKSDDPATTLHPDIAQSYQWIRIVEKTSKDAKLREGAAKVATELETKLDAPAIAAAQKAAAEWKPVPVDQLGPAPGISLP